MFKYSSVALECLKLKSGYADRQHHIRGVRIIPEDHISYNISIFGDHSLPNLDWNCDNLNGEMYVVTLKL